MKNISRIIAAGTMGALLLLLQCGPERDREWARPNFVWIISEDNSKHYMELFDPNGIATPNIERLAEDGILFTRAFSNAPVCSVARSTLISSCYAPRTGTQFHRRSAFVTMPEGVEMFPAYLKSAGYHTTNNSKEDYNYLKSEGTWDESSPAAHWSSRQPGQPFFHKESHPVTHEGRLHFDAAFMRDYDPVTDPGAVHLFPVHPDTELFRFTGAYYRDRILVMDSIVGNVLKQLEEEGLLENTFVFYFSDHGGVLPGSKGYTYETGLHVPLVVRIPEHFRHLVDFRRGSETDGFVSFVDFGPTLLKLSGIPLPDGIDGIPFLGQEISSRMVGNRQVTYGYADRFDEKYDLVRTVRKGRMKYMRNYQPFNVDGLQNNYRYRCLAYQQWREMYRQDELNEVQRRFFENRDAEALYDLATDPYETVNLAEDPAYSGSLWEMRDLMEGWVKGMPDLSFIPESVLRRDAFDNSVAYGQQHKDDIAALIDIANLSLRPFEQARTGIAAAMRSGDPLKVYWGLIVCSSFGEEASPFFDLAVACCRHEDLLVRTRAAEFLALTGRLSPVQVISEALSTTDDTVEALLILNSLVLLMDGEPGYDFNLDNINFTPGVLEDDEVQRRLEYIRTRMEQPG